MHKLLIVSDSQRFRAWARLVVEAEGCDVVEARDGLAALQYAIEAAPTLILIDPDLSEVFDDGLQASRSLGLSAIDVRMRLRTEPQTETIPVVLPFSAFLRNPGAAAREGTSGRSMRRSTATLSLRETLFSVLSSGRVLATPASRVTT